MGVRGFLCVCAWAASTSCGGKVYQSPSPAPVWGDNNAWEVTTPGTHTRGAGASGTTTRRRGHRRPRTFEVALHALAGVRLAHGVPLDLAKHCGLAAKLLPNGVVPAATNESTTQRRAATQAEHTGRSSAHMQWKRRGGGVTRTRGWWEAEGPRGPRRHQHCVRLACGSGKGRAATVAISRRRTGRRGGARGHRVPRTAGCTRLASTF
jgi:hypothetical protein